MRTPSGLGMVIGSALITGSISFGPPQLRAQSRETPSSAAARVAPSSGKEAVSPFIGSWTYRSFVSDPILSTPTEKLLFGAGTMTLSVPAPDHLAGTLGGDDWQLDLKGGVTAGNPATIRFQGKGKIDGEEWIYDYLGFLVPVWPNGESQRPAIVGTIVRTKAHSDGKGGIAPAGAVAQWIAVRQDATGGSAVARSMQQAGSDRSTPAAGAGATEDTVRKAAAARRLRGLYEEEDRIERQRDEESKRREAAPRPARAPDAKPSGAALSAGPFRTNFQPSPSLHPMAYSSKSGRLDLILNLGYGVHAIGKDQVRMRTYNGGLVGPVLRVKAGDVLYITLVNELPLNPNPPKGHDVNVNHDWNTTNLHFHGLHVAPEGPKGQPDKESDNVLLEVKPSQPFDPKVSVQKYEVHIPANHPAGTFWYHAHKHGSSAAQVSSGLVGALIVDRDNNVTNLDSIPEVKAAAQEVMVLQQIPYLSKVSGDLGAIEPTSNESIDAMFAPTEWKKARRYTLVNGLRIPTITLAPGEVRRLRLIDAGQREPIKLRIEPATKSARPGSAALEFHEIALDGLPTGALTQRSEIEIHPGYRSDVLVKAPENASGDYYLVDANLDDRSGADGSPEPVRWIAKLVVTGQKVKMELPPAEQLLAQRLELIQESEVTGAPRYAFFGIEFLPNTKFLISERNLAATAEPVNSSNEKDNPFSLTRERRLPLNKTEKWIVGSRNGPTTPNGKPLGVSHPFHIHVNPFLITKVTKVDEKSGEVIDVPRTEFSVPTWRDTLSMKQGYTYELLIRYEDFTGSFVEHCHILDHEDRGMMEKLTIEDPKVAAGTRARLPARTASARCFPRSQASRRYCSSSGGPSVSIA